MQETRRRKQMTSLVVDDLNVDSSANQTNSDIDQALLERPANPGFSRIAGILGKDRRGLPAGAGTGLTSSFGGRTKTGAGDQIGTGFSRTKDEILLRSGSSDEAVMAESSWQIGRQVFFPYIVAGLGMVGAGVVLNLVKQWKVFVEVSQIVILVPALLGLKGNLEMTLASRLSTHANLGNMESKYEQMSLAGGNLALTQIQAVVVGFLSSIFAIVLNLILRGQLEVNHALLLITSSVLTASFASLILGCLVIGVIVLSKSYQINPDNVATPIAGSLGDLTTVIILAGVSTMLYRHMDNPHYLWMMPLLLGLVVLLLPIWFIVARRNKHTRDVLYNGWTPVIGAMVISSFGGLVLDHTIVRFEGIAMFQPVINGIGGNLVAIQASRMSTALHQVSVPGVLPTEDVKSCQDPCSSLCGTNAGARSAKVLLAMVVPGQLIFAFAIWLIHYGEWTITFSFIASYLLAALIQVALLLYTANWLVVWLWMQGIDPDNSSIPYLTAIGDLSGSLLLALAFYVQ